jgi:Protein of unknown function (DUF1688)
MDAITYLRSTQAVRERCNNILSAVVGGESRYFAVDFSALPAVASQVDALTLQRFPSGKIPYHARWRHFEAGGIDRLSTLPLCSDLDERARREIDLAVTAVLLDAGSGPHWQYTESATGWQGGRSEGLGVAAFHTFASGLFGGSPAAPIACASGLAMVSVAAIGEQFQASNANPLVGLEGRTSLLVRLSQALLSHPEFFGAANADPRPGHMFDTLVYKDGVRQTQVKAAEILQIVLEGFGSIWLTSNKLLGASLGDCWQHPLAGGEGDSAGWVPFHKLSQWMTYSLLEPFERAGIEVVGLEALTGLPEYRNGGLLLDMGVIRPHKADLLNANYEVSHLLVIEWRALTVALLDKVADQVRKQRGVTQAELPLACVLEGGTWAAGRITAQRLRQGLPPINVISDGTVF